MNEPIVVKAGQTFNGEGKLYQAGPSLGDGGQSETQKPVFILEPGAKLENVQVAGGDGIHTRGDATLKDVWWKDVGEDAMTMKGPGNVKVIGGGAYAATDKIFQINAPGSLSIDGFTADGFGKAVRTNGGHDFPISIDIRNSVFRNGDEAVVRSDAKDAKINIVLNKSLEMSTGKAAAQAAHALFAWLTEAPAESVEAWLQSHAPVGIRHLPRKDFEQLSRQAAGPVIQDAGRTEIEPGSVTAFVMSKAS